MQFTYARTERAPCVSVCRSHSDERKTRGVGVPMIWLPRTDDVDATFAGIGACACVCERGENERAKQK